MVLSELKGRAQQQQSPLLHVAGMLLVAELQRTQKENGAQRVNDPEHHPWVEPPCWFKTCTSKIVEKRLIYSSIVHQHEEYDQDGNVARNSKKCLSGHMPFKSELEN